jgi:hypothetical protein
MVAVFLVLLSRCHGALALPSAPLVLRRDAFDAH